MIKICKKTFKTFPSKVGHYCSYSCNNVKKPGTFKKGHKWVGKFRTEKRKMQHGYIEIYSPNYPNKNVRNGVLEHRIVMEKHLKRYLLPEEVVHHINFNVSDNRLKNLMLFPNQALHAHHHSILKNHGH
jgi:hypothetical protein